MAQLFAYILHKEGVVDDTARELVTAAKKMDPDASPTAIVMGSGGDLDAACNQAAEVYPQVWRVDNDAMAYPNAEVIREALSSLLPQGSLLLVPHEHFGLDLSPGLSVKLNAAYLPDVVDLEPVQGDTIKAVRQEYSGMVSTHVEADLANGAVITIRPGSFAPDESQGANGQISDQTVGSDALPTNRRFVEIVAAEVGDVDISQSEVLVSVGRGIEDEDNLEIIHDLGEAMGGDVSCSRPIVDAKWLEKSRQVGTSGKTVKPKVYLALGISGSFQHLGGIKGNPFIVAVNKNPKAPIFQVADVGVVDDILDFVPELTDKINEMK